MFSFLVNVSVQIREEENQAWQEPAAVVKASIEKYLRLEFSDAFTKPSHYYTLRRVE
jgi:hypothetical protein